MSEIKVITEETCAKLTAFAVEVQRELLLAGLPAYAGLASQAGALVTVNSLDSRGVEVAWHCPDRLFTPMFEATADNIIADDLPGPNPSRDWCAAINRTMLASITTILTAAGRSVVELESGDVLVEMPEQADSAMTGFRLRSPEQQVHDKLNFLGMAIEHQLSFTGLPLVPSAGRLAPAEATGVRIFVDPGEPNGVLVGWQCQTAPEPLRQAMLASIGEILTAAGWPVAEHGTDHLLVNSKGTLSPWVAWHTDQSDRRDQRWRDAVNAGTPSVAEWWWVTC